MGKTNKGLERLKRVQDANKMRVKPITTELGDAYMKYFRNDTATTIYGVKLTKKDLEDYIAQINSAGENKCIALAFAKFDSGRLAQEPGGGLIDPDLIAKPERDNTFTIIIGLGDCGKGNIEAFKGQQGELFYDDWNDEWP